MLPAMRLGRSAGPLLLVVLLGIFTVAAARGDDTLIYRLWEKFYTLQQSEPLQARDTLDEILAETPDDVAAWKSKGYLELDQGNQQAALDAFLRAEELAPNDESLKLQIAYLLNAMQRNREAYARFDDLTGARDTQIADTACTAVSNLAGASTKVLPAPWYALFAASPSWESRSDLGVLPMDLRIGRTFEDGLLDVYGFVHFNRDNRSSGGAAPVIYDANEIVTGVGAALRPFDGVPLAFYGQAGVRKDLIERNRTSPDGDYELGMFYSDAWGDTSAGCFRGWDMPLTPYLTAYGHLATYSEDDYNTIVETQARAGLNLLRGAIGNVAVYAYGGLEADTKRYYYNNTLEVGPGVAWRLPVSTPLVLRAETRYRRYIGGGSPVANPGNDDDVYFRFALDFAVVF